MANEIGRIDGLLLQFAYMDDGTILVWNGSRWTFHGMCEGDPHEAFAKAKRQHDEFMASRPALAAYQKAMLAIFDREHMLRANSIMILNCWTPEHVQRAVYQATKVQLSDEQVEELCRLCRASREEKERIERESGFRR